MRVMSSSYYWYLKKGVCLKDHDGYKGCKDVYVVYIVTHVNKLYIEKHWFSTSHCRKVPENS